MSFLDLFFPNPFEHIFDTPPPLSPYEKVLNAIEDAIWPIPVAIFAVFILFIAYLIILACIRAFQEAKAAKNIPPAEWIKGGLIKPADGETSDKRECGEV